MNTFQNKSQAHKAQETHNQLLQQCIQISPSFEHNNQLLHIVYFVCSWVLYPSQKLTRMKRSGLMCIGRYSDSKYVIAQSNYWHQILLRKATSFSITN